MATDPTSPAARLADLMRQGFMKPRKAPRAAAKRPTVACMDCRNWHAQGKHTADAATRKSNRAEDKARGCTEPRQRVIG